MVGLGRHAIRRCAAAARRLRMPSLQVGCRTCESHPESRARPRSASGTTTTRGTDQRTTSWPVLNVPDSIPCTRNRVRRGIHLRLSSLVQENGPVRSCQSRGLFQPSTDFELNRQFGQGRIRPGRSGWADQTDKRGRGFGLCCGAVPRHHAGRAGRSVSSSSAELPFTGEPPTEFKLEAGAGVRFCNAASPRAR